jgi:hypothetical protein
VSDLRDLLEQFYRAKLGSLLRHEAAARLIRQYDVNNTYQYIINREETQLSWLAAAIAELGGTPDESAAEPSRGSRDDAGVVRKVIQEDSIEAQAFVDAWKDRIEAMTNARHRGMLRVILGETLEQKRFFDLALAGEHDLLGKRIDPVGPRIGEVLATRWIE